MTTQTDRTSANPSRDATGAAPTSGESELDKLLSDFKQQTPPQQAVETSIIKELAPVIKYAKGRMEDDERAAFNDDVAKAVTFVSEAEEVKGLPQRFVRGYLHDLAAEQPTFRDAFVNRRQSPEDWEKALTNARTAIAEEAKVFMGGRLRTDIEAARAAVTGQSSTAPPEKPLPSNTELENMSDRDYAALKRGLLASAGA